MSSRALCPGPLAPQAPSPRRGRRVSTFYAPRSQAGDRSRRPEQAEESVPGIKPGMTPARGARSGSAEALKSAFERWQRYPPYRPQGPLPHGSWTILSDAVHRKLGGPSIARALWPWLTVFGHSETGSSPVFRSSGAAVGAASAFTNAPAAFALPA